MTQAQLARPALTIAAAAALTLWLVPGAAAQPPRQLRPLENIKVLTGWTGADVREEMRRMTDALGVKCDHCHVQGNFASDEKRAKKTGRRMLELTLALNKEYFPEHSRTEGGSRLGRVTCYTCHQGEVTPKMTTGGGFER